jgi:hypothetical protein
MVLPSVSTTSMDSASCAGRLVVQRCPFVQATCHRQVEWASDRARLNPPSECATDNATEIFSQRPLIGAGSSALHDCGPGDPRHLSFRRVHPEI